MFKNLLDKENRAGLNTAKIENQDSVGIITALELLSVDGIFSDLDCFDSDWTIVPEGYDDLDIILPDSRVFIQVKSEIITPGELQEILFKFQNTYQTILAYSSNSVRFKINALKGLSKSLSALKDKLDELRNCKKIYSTQEFEDNLLIICNQYKIDHILKDVVTNLSIDERRMFKYEDETIALFAHLLRKAYKFRDFADSLIKEIFDNLLEYYDYCRLKRKPMNRKQILTRLNRIINYGGPLDSSTSMWGSYYQLTERGYEKTSKDSQKLIQDIHKGCTKARNKVFKAWIKYHWKSLVVTNLFGTHDRCLVCGHPLVAKFGGFFGLSCPDCGYQPFNTLLLVCNCGNYSIVKKQPSLNGDDISEYIRYFFLVNSSECSKCGQDLTNNLLYRMMMVPFPIPVSEYRVGNLKSHFPGS